jgi:hypothetical protein
VTVTLGIYSGRPDPSWELDEAQTADLFHTLYGLPVASARLPEGGLGYRGFGLVVTTPGTGEGNLVAYRGVVAGSGTGEVRLDSTRSVERFLLETGRSRLAPAEIAAVEADLGLP